ncbi:nephrin-like [Penaeus monodon]|uniref:nephrin-like n=1 Tax=Penaeus monodon TaxID=6687 RepID=UPI0018A7474C|nr:nephrin-like [Penaeus monodon]
MRQLVCRAVNALLPEETLEDILTLDVQYKPMVTMSLGRSLDPDNLKEENDIFFDCKVDANPDPYKVEWWHDNDLVTQNLAEGVLVSESTLALQRVSRDKSGSYQCRASNVEGDTTSDPVNISIKYAPRCAVSPSLRGVGLQEPINVTCEVDADPVDVTFTWTFNNSVRREQSEIVDSKRYTTEKLRSVLFYTPRSERDYGTLLCHAQNSVGLQTTPCSFTVISAGALEVTNCGLKPYPAHPGSVPRGKPGFNGGLPQSFMLEVWLLDPVKSQQIVLNYTLPQPVFSVRSLSPGQHYRVHVTAVNGRGAAPAAVLEIHTLKEAEMHKSLPSRSEPSPLMLVLAVIGGALLVVIMLLVGVWAVRGRRRHAHAQREALQIPMKESNPDILEAAPPPTSPGHTINISVIKHPHDLNVDTSPSHDLALDPLGAARAHRNNGTSQKTAFGVSEPLHRPIEKSLQSSTYGAVIIRFLFDNASSVTVIGRGQTTLV